jgi:hypothetical protein
MARILLTNLYMSFRSGSEIATGELAAALKRRGHEVAIYAPLLGPYADEVRSTDVMVVDRPDKVAFRPDLIHAHHSPVAVAAIACHPGVPAIFVSHSSVYWVEAPPSLARFVRCYAVDEACRERAEQAVPRFAGKVQLLLNAVDLAKFVRRATLPKQPARALILTKQHGYVETVRMAAEAAGLSVDAIGPGVGNVVSDLPLRLPDYDIVFATARMAIEALAVGCAVIVVDQRGLAGMVRAANVATWRQDNFGLRLLNRPVTADLIRAEIARYDPADTAATTDAIRALAGVDELAAHVETIHAEVLAEFAGNPPSDPAQELVEIGRFLSDWSGRLKIWANPEAGEEASRIAASPPAPQLLQTIADLHRQVGGRNDESMKLQRENAALAARTDVLSRELEKQNEDYLLLQRETANVRLSLAERNQILRSGTRTFRHLVGLIAQKLGRRMGGRNQVR